VLIFRAHNSAPTYQALRARAKVYSGFPRNWRRMALRSVAAKVSIEPADTFRARLERRAAERYPTVDFRPVDFDTRGVSLQSLMPNPEMI